MDSELNAVLQTIKDRTGLDVGLFSETMKFTAATRKDLAILPNVRKDFGDVYSDPSTGRTYFRAVYRSEKLIGFVEGTGEAERKYAHLVAALVESIAGRDASLSRAEQLRAILLGDAGRPQIMKFMRRFTFPDLPCYALSVASPAGRTAEIMNFLTNYATDSPDAALPMEDGSVAYIRFLDEAREDEFQSAADYAALAAQSIREECGVAVKIGVGGTVRHLQEINVSYQQASTALRMCSLFKSKGDVHSYREYILVRMLEDLPKYKLVEYLDQLADEASKAVFEDPDMVNTAEEFLENSLNVSETSRNLYMHRNTLMYRLDKIERATGLNIRNFPDAVTFRLITVLYKLIH